MGITILKANTKDHTHINEIIRVVSAYKLDPMGAGSRMKHDEVEALKNLLFESSNCSVFLAYKDDQLAGGAVCFTNFVTFSARPSINIHDLFVFKECRGLGIGKRLIARIMDFAKESNCGKITLEVLEGNNPAKQLYQSYGFCHTNPIMAFWVKNLQ